MLYWIYIQEKGGGIICFQRQGLTRVLNTLNIVMADALGNVVCIFVESGREGGWIWVCDILCTHARGWLYGAVFMVDSAVWFEVVVFVRLLEGLNRMRWMRVGFMLVSW